jgi:hypothetical protein
MQEFELAANDDDALMVELQGRPVGCLSVEDAAAVKFADEILDDRTEHFVLPEELDQIVSVLSRYCRSEAAETLAQLAGRLRAAQYDRWADG